MQRLTNDKRECIPTKGNVYKPRYYIGFKDIKSLEFCFGYRWEKSDCNDTDKLLSFCNHFVACSSGSMLHTICFVERSCR